MLCFALLCFAFPSYAVLCYAKLRVLCAHICTLVHADSCTLVPPLPFASPPLTLGTMSNNGDDADDDDNETTMMILSSEKPVVRIRDMPH